MLLGVWDDALSSKLDDEMGARITGVNATMHTFDFLCGVSLGNVLLNQTDHFSKSFTSRPSAAEGLRLANLTTSVLKSLREQENFKSFYIRVFKRKIVFRSVIQVYPEKKEIQRLPSQVYGSTCF